MSKTRSTLYRLARNLGDYEAAAKGPTALGKRLIRKQVYRRTGGTTRRLLRVFGL